MQGRGERNSFHGRKHSDETKAKIGAAVRARHEADPGYRRRLGDANRGKVRSQEARARISAGRRGTKRGSDDDILSAKNTEARMALYRLLGLIE